VPKATLSAVQQRTRAWEACVALIAHLNDVFAPAIKCNPLCLGSIKLPGASEFTPIVLTRLGNRTTV
jgi:hypothetical protein